MATYDSSATAADSQDSPGLGNVPPPLLETLPPARPPMRTTKQAEMIRLCAAAICLIAAAVAWSHSGPHSPKPLQPPAISPGSFGKGDPVPNRVDSETGLTTGGIGYAWSVTSVGSLTAVLSGIVGASSWSDPESLAPDEGTTRASSWVALNLQFPSLVTVRLSRASNVPDPLGLLPGDTGGGDLRPAFTIYSGWQESGADETVYPTRSAIPWAPALSYHSHIGDEGDGLVETTVELPAGKYSIALGGIGAPGFDAGRQGYEARFTTLSRALPASVLTKGKRFKTTKKKFRLTGRFLNPESAAFVAIQQNKKTKFLAARGRNWVANLTGLKPGVNTIYITAISLDGKISSRKKVTITRK